MWLASFSVYEPWTEEQNYYSMSKFVIVTFKSPIKKSRKMLSLKNSQTRNTHLWITNHAINRFLELRGIFPPFQWNKTFQVILLLFSTLHKWLWDIALYPSIPLFVGISFFSCFQGYFIKLLPLYLMQFLRKPHFVINKPSNAQSFLYYISVLYRDSSFTWNVHPKSNR